MMSKPYEDYVRENKTVVEEAEEQIYKLTSENMELYRKIRVGKDAEKQLEKNQEALQNLMTVYLGIKGEK